MDGVRRQIRGQTELPPSLLSEQISPIFIDTVGGLAHPCAIHN